MHTGFLDVPFLFFATIIGAVRHGPGIPVDSRWPSDVKEKNVR